MAGWKEIDRLKARLDGLRPFPPAALKSLREKIELEWTHNSNAIEGNSLTLKETKAVLEGITVGGKSLREHLEAVNHGAAVQYLNEIIAGGEEISEWQIRTIHSLVLKGIDQKGAGAYRKENVFISGARHVPPDHILVPDEMKALILRFQKKWAPLHPAERAALLHIDFVKIHPFADGNGRTARLLQNFELMKAGFPLIVIKKESRLKYYSVLDKAHASGEAEDFIKLSAGRLEEALKLYLKAFG